MTKIQPLIALLFLGVSAAHAQLAAADASLDGRLAAVRSKYKL